MTCLTSPAVETTYTLLAYDTGVIVTPGNIPILLSTYEASRGTIGAPLSAGGAIGANSTGSANNPLSSGNLTTPLPTGSITGPKESC